MQEEGGARRDKGRGGRRASSGRRVERQGIQLLNLTSIVNSFLSTKGPMGSSELVSLYGIVCCVTKGFHK